MFSRMTRPVLPSAQSIPIAVALLALVCLAVPSTAQVDPAVEARIDSIFAEWDRPHSPGAAVGVVRDGRLVFARGYGSAQIEHGIPIRPDTPFHVASESKQFTAVAILMLARRGTLSLDDEVGEWIAEMPDFPWPVTIRHLLNHTSGLRDQWQALALAGRYEDDAITTDDVLRMVERQRELNFRPGFMELYSNTGYTLLAEVVARASGLTFREFTRREIFDPLGMSDTHFHDDLREPVPGRAYSYGTNAGTGAVERRILNYAVPGATGLFTTVEDMGKWLAELAEPALGDSSLYAPLYARDTLNDGAEVLWGYGMNVGEHRGRARHGHGGGDAGFRAWSVRFPDEDLAVIVLANTSAINPGPFGDALVLRVADLFLPPPPAVERPAPPGPPEPDLDPFVGSYRFADGRILNVTDEFGVLKLWDPGERTKTALEPVGPGVFAAVGDPGERVEFEREGERVERLRLGGPAGLRVGERVEPVPPEGPAEYAGAYRSPELETTWTLVVEDGALVARHLMHEDVPLTPVVRDLFAGSAWFMREVRFSRDAAGEVDGLWVSAGRIKNVRFDRMR